MRRLLGIFILSLFTLGMSTQSSVAQFSSQDLNLSKKEYKVLRSKVRKMTLEAKIDKFFLSTRNAIKVVDLDSITELRGIPLPSKEALLKSGMTYPDFIAGVLHADFVFNSYGYDGAKFFGLDSMGTVLNLEPYDNFRSLVTALIKHDFILIADDSKNFLLDRKLTGSEKRDLELKLIEALTSKKTLKKDPSPPEVIQEWAIKVYASNKEIQNIDVENNNIKNFNIPDDNWLSNLISRQVQNKVFNESGERIKLAEGSTELFNLDSIRLETIDSIISRAIEVKAMPGCQLLVAKNGYVVLDKYYGHQTYDSIIKINQNTLYDLASLTKVLATTQALMLLYDDGEFDPERKLSEYLPYLIGTNKEKITGAQVLSHQANLYPYFPFWKKARNEFNLDDMHGDVVAGGGLMIESWVGDSIIHWAAKSDLLSDKIDSITRAEYFYSDVGFFFLKDLIEQQAGTSIELFLRDRLYKPTNIDLLYNPWTSYPDSIIAPTEIDQLLRNELIRGYVHDRNAALLGGTAGQAGLFGNARNVAELMQIHLDNGKYMENTYFSDDAIHEFTTRHFKNNRRGLGWDMPGPEPDGPVSKYASNGTFGHTGFTGGMIWADPKESLVFVFLSNRVYPSVDNNKIIELNLRTNIQDIVYESLGYQ